MKSLFVSVKLTLTVLVKKVFLTISFAQSLKVYRFVLISFLSLALSSCAYKLSNQVDTLPGGVKSVFVPPFKNLTDEPDVEVEFTQSLRKEMLTSKVVRLEENSKEADAFIEGTIETVNIKSDESVVEAKNTKYLPYNTVLSTQIKVEVLVQVVLKKTSTQEVLWSSSFKQARNYTPPQVTLPVVNSVNNLYNLSARRQTFETLSKEMMQLAFDRMVDQF